MRRQSACRVYACRIDWGQKRKVVELFPSPSHADGRVALRFHCTRLGDAEQKSSCRASGFNSAGLKGRINTPATPSFSPIQYTPSPVHR
jgi:hypothetical protein